MFGGTPGTSSRHPCVSRVAAPWLGITALESAKFWAMAIVFDLRDPNPGLGMTVRMIHVMESSESATE